jgi:RNA-binding protein YlmH
MEKTELIRRAEDLLARCLRSGVVTHTGFLSPAERYELERWAAHTPDCSAVFSGGGPDCERTVCFFLPEWQEKESFEPAESLRAIRITAHFGTPGHRDYMGALLGMGIGREWLGDIRVAENIAYIFCLPSVLRHLLSIEKVGRCGVTAEELAPSAVPAPERKGKQKSFSVQSLRLDAVVGGMFNLSRTEAARQISAGNVSINYQESLKTDFAVKENDIVSLRGAGKGRVTGTGGTSRKGRLFVYAEIYQ